MGLKIGCTEKMFDFTIFFNLTVIHQSYPKFTDALPVDVSGTTVDGGNCLKMAPQTPKNYYILLGK